MGSLSKALKGLLEAGMAEGKVVQYPDEWIGKVPTNLRKEVASHNEGLLGSVYRDSFENAPTFYHGTGSDISEFNIDKGTRKTQDTGAWFSTNPHTSSTYAGRVGGNVMPVKIRDSDAVTLDVGGSAWGDIDPFSYLDKQQYGGEELSDLFDIENNITTDHVARLVRGEGHDSILFKNLADIGPHSTFSDYKKAGNPSDVLASFDPSNIRSVNAVFDPAKSSSSNILASNPVATTGAGLLGLTALAPDDARAAEIAATDMRDVGSIKELPQDYSQQLANAIANQFGGNQASRNRRVQSLGGILDFTPIGGADSMREGQQLREEGNTLEGLISSILGAAEFVPLAGQGISKGVRGARGLLGI